MRVCATSNGEQRVQVLIQVVQGLSQKQRQLMQQCFEVVGWQGLKLLSAERRQRDSLKSFELSVNMWKDWIRLKKELATLGEKLPPTESLPAKRKEQSPDPTKRDASPSFENIIDLPYGFFPINNIISLSLSEGRKQRGIRRESASRR